MENKFLLIKLFDFYVDIAIVKDLYMVLGAYNIEEEDRVLKMVGLELMFLTPEKCHSDKGITAVELSKSLDLPSEIIKKKLKILQEKQIIRCRGINPKYWKFDEYNFQRLDENDPIYILFCSFDDVDFSRYFEY